MLPFHHSERRVWRSGEESGGGGGGGGGRQREAVGMVGRTYLSEY